MKNNLGVSTQPIGTLPSLSISGSIPGRSPVKRAPLTNQADFYNKRIGKIQALFNQNQISLDEYLPERELLGFLDYLGDCTFDRDVAAQLFDKLPPYPDQLNQKENLYHVQEFVETHIKAEYLLLQQINEIEQELNKTYAEIDVIKRQYDSQVLGKTSDQDNTIHLDVKEAVCEDGRFNARKGDRYSISLVSKPYRYETDEVPTNGGVFHVQFNHSFHIRTGQESDSVSIILRNNDAMSRDPNYNDLKCTLTLDQLSNLADNELHWFTLQDIHGNDTAFKVSGNITCNISKVSFLEEHLRNLLQLEAQLQESRDSVESTLRALVHPFAFAQVNSAYSPTKGLATSGIPNHQNNILQIQTEYKHQDIQ